MGSENANSSATAKIALVTGAGKRIGAAIAGALHARGMTVAIHCNESSREASELERRLSSSRSESAAVFQADLSQSEASRRLVERVVERFSALDVLVNNASVFFPTPVGEITAGQFDAMVAVNLRAPCMLVEAAKPWLVERRGSVVNITDLYANRPASGYSAYCATKAGLESLTRSMALELAPHVRVNAVAPGAVLWPQGQGEDADIIQRTPLRRAGRAEDVARAVSYLAIEATFTTGQVLSVDGGRSVIEP